MNKDPKVRAKARELISDWLSDGLDYYSVAEQTEDAETAVSVYQETERLVGLIYMSFKQMV